jgi:hypothetical protein
MASLDDAQSNKFVLDSLTDVLYLFSLKISCVFAAVLARRVVCDQDGHEPFARRLKSLRKAMSRRGSDIDEPFFLKA